MNSYKRFVCFKINDTLILIFDIIVVFAVPNYYYFRANGDYQFEEFLATTELTYIIVEIKAADRAQIALIYNPNDVQGNVCNWSSDIIRKTYGDR